ncbi:hypothetical protein [Mycoplasmopsis gallinacea]|uniref:Uncharacterized protein n=1 Tax=Mycoplasmopsis gallinacea TaxID=29556 RepID=A0A449A301_9BACT|nr:hypothetical protein [Mycoplasmopsis gallinacea]VEU58574.1 Uncharacterised protein [Mycoplasmopsis gallinacea]
MDEKQIEQVNYLSQLSILGTKLKKKATISLILLFVAFPILIGICLGLFFGLFNGVAFFNTFLKSKYKFSNDILPEIITLSILGFLLFMWFITYIIVLVMLCSHINQIKNTVYMHNDFHFYELGTAKALILLSLLPIGTISWILLLIGLIIIRKKASFLAFQTIMILTDLASQIDTSQFDDDDDDEFYDEDLDDLDEDDEYY